MNLFVYVCVPDNRGISFLCLVYVVAGFEVDLGTVAKLNRLFCELKGASRIHLYLNPQSHQGKKWLEAS